MPRRWPPASPAGSRGDDAGNPGAGHHGPGHRLRLQRQRRALRRHGAGPARRQSGLRRRGGGSRCRPRRRCWAGRPPTTSPPASPPRRWPPATSPSRCSSPCSTASSRRWPRRASAPALLPRPFGRRGRRRRRRRLLTWPTAARLVVTRSRHQATTRGAGPHGRARRGAGGCAADPRRTRHDRRARIEIAAINAPESLTVAGPAALLAKLEAAAAEQRWSFLALDLDYAFHSAAMDGLRDGLLADLAGLAGQPCRVPLLSTVTGAALDAGGCGPAHWWRNLREPVQFQAAMQAAASSAPACSSRSARPRCCRATCARPCGPRGRRPAILPACRAATPPPTPSPASPTAPGSPAPIRAAAPPSPAPRGAAAAAYPVRPPAHLVRPNRRSRAPAIAPVEDHPLLGFRQGAEPGLWSRHMDTAWSPGWPTTAWPGNRCCRPPPCRDRAGRRPRPPPGCGRDRAARVRRIHQRPAAGGGPCARAARQPRWRPAPSPWNPAAAWLPRALDPACARRRVATLPAAGGRAGRAAARHPAGRRGDPGARAVGRPALRRRPSIADMR